MLVKETGYLKAQCRNNDVTTHLSWPGEKRIENTSTKQGRFWQEPPAINRSSLMLILPIDTYIDRIC